MEDDPSYQIEIVRRESVGAVVCNDDALSEAVRRTLGHFNCPHARVGVALLDDDQISELHERHLGQPGPTDVLSFNLSESDSEVLEGEVAVSVDTARREAAARGHSPEAELVLYCIHGTLHLLGFEDAQPGDAAKMHEIEDRLLTELGWGPVYRGPEG